VSARFYRNPNGTGLCEQSAFVKLLAKERPRAQPEGACEAGIGQRRGCQDRSRILLGRLHPAAGSHLPSEETAPPLAVVPFASSPFAHPISQSRRRASEDLFSASLEHVIPGLTRNPAASQQIACFDATGPASDGYDVYTVCSPDQKIDCLPIPAGGSPPCSSRLLHCP
jgi:hypothetical protein